MLPRPRSNNGNKRTQRCSCKYRGPKTDGGSGIFIDTSCFKSCPHKMSGTGANNTDSSGDRQGLHGAQQGGDQRLRCRVIRGNIGQSTEHSLCFGHPGYRSSDRTKRPRSRGTKRRCKTPATVE